MHPRDRLARIVAASGLSREQFATRVLACSPSTLRRYLNGSAVVPATLVRWMDLLPNPSVSELIGTPDTPDTH